MQKLFRHAAGALALGLVIGLMAETAEARTHHEIRSRTNQGTGTSGMARPVGTPATVVHGRASEVYQQRSSDPAGPWRTDGLFSRNVRPSQEIHSNRGAGISRRGHFERTFVVR